MLTMRGDALLDQAAVADDAGRCALAALALYQAKGNRPGVARAQAAAYDTAGSGSTR